MRVAVLDADPRICGPLHWARHLRTGFESRGDTCEVVSSTKSGRPRSSWGTPKWGGQWSTYAPDSVVKDADLADKLNEYDLIVLPEPKVPAIDKQALKAGAYPAYARALIETGTPWLTALHGNNYRDKDAPFMAPMFESRSFTGTVISHSQRSIANSDLPAGVVVVPLPLPYAPQRDVTSDLPSAPSSVGTTGRVMFNKGTHVVALAATEIRDEALEVELWGAATMGLSANVTFSIYESLLPHAERYARYGDQEEKRAAGHPGVTEHGNTIRPFLWDVRLTSGPVVRYLGNYVDPVETSARLRVHVNLTSSKYSGGLVEYSTLEALDAGCLCVTPEHVSSDVFITRRVPISAPPGTIASTLKNWDVVTGMAAVISETLRESNDEVHRREVVQHNRQALRRVNDPRAIADVVVNGALR